MQISEGITFDDVLLVPKYSEIKSRGDINLSVNLCKNFSFKSPIIPANMKDIVSEELIEASYKIGMMSLLHRFSSIDDQINILNNLKLKFGNNIFDFAGISIGVKEDCKDILSKFVDLGIKIICLDVAHLDSILGWQMINYIHDKYPKLLLIAGNVATADAAERAWRAGADIVKCGIGNGSICSTRLETGNGVPQLTAIMNIYKRKILLEQKINRKLYFISDGGHSKTADCVKSLCFADMVMLGSMIAGVKESSGKTININGAEYKYYAGSSTHKNNRIEGVKALVKSKNTFNNLITKIHEGIQSGCSYQNSSNLNDLKLNPEFIKITNSGLNESKIHDVIQYE